MNDEKSLEFIENLARSSTGKKLIEYLKKVEIYYADIRNIGQTKPEVRIDALKMFRESLLDKLLVLRGELTRPEGDEFR